MGRAEEIARRRQLERAAAEQAEAEYAARLRAAQIQGAFADAKRLIDRLQALDWPDGELLRVQFEKKQRRRVTVHEEERAGWEVCAFDEFERGGGDYEATYRVFVLSDGTFACWKTRGYGGERIEPIVGPTALSVFLSRWTRNHLPDVVTGMQRLLATYDVPAPTATISRTQLRRPRGARG